MCGRYTNTKPLNEIQDRFNIPDEDVQIDFDSYRPNYNVAPTHNVPTVVFDGQKKHLKFMRWGLIPSWAKDAKIGYSMINARDDSIAVKPSFKNLIKANRCLIIADGFYEFKAVGKTKQPVRFVLKDKSIFAFAGLFSNWKNSETGQTITTCTIITTSPNEIVKPYHDRMPVIVTRENESKWLDPKNQTHEQIKDIVTPISEKIMTDYYVNPAVNSVKNNAAYLIEPFDYTEN